MPIIVVIISTFIRRSYGVHTLLSVFKSFVLHMIIVSDIFFYLDRPCSGSFELMLRNISTYEIVIRRYTYSIMTWLTSNHNIYISFVKK